MPSGRIALRWGSRSAASWSGRLDNVPGDGPRPPALVTPECPAKRTFAMSPQIRYADSGNVKIAYQVLGDGPGDLVLVPGFISNVEVAWEEPCLARFLRRLATFRRLIVFDKRGTGLSDRVADMPSLEI